MKKCPNCGTEVNENSNFCLNCGSNISNVQTQSNDEENLLNSNGNNVIPTNDEIKTNEPENSQLVNTQVTTNAFNQEPMQKKDKNSKTDKIILAIVLALIGFIGIYLLFTVIFKDDKKDNVAENFSITPTTITLGIGKSSLITANPDGNILWTSSNSKIATVDNNGIVTGVKEGVATIIVKNSKGKTASCLVTVTKEKTTHELLEEYVNTELNGLDEQINELYGDTLTFSIEIRDNSIAYKYKYKVTYTSAQVKIIKENLDSSITDESDSVKMIKAGYDELKKSVPDLDAFIMEYYNGNGKLISSKVIN